MRTNDKGIQRVVVAAKSVLGDALDTTHEALCISTEMLGFAPIPGFVEAAKMLLNIWDAAQAVYVRPPQSPSPCIC